MGEGDKEDLKVAQDAYAIARGAVRGALYILPHWDDLNPKLRDAFQFVAAHAAINERMACADLIAGWPDVVLKKEPVGTPEFDAGVRWACLHLPFQIRQST